MKNKDTQMLEEAYGKVLTPTATGKKTVEKFAKDFEKLLAEYPDVFVGSDYSGNLKAYYQPWAHPELGLSDNVNKDLPSFANKNS